MAFQRYLNAILRRNVCPSAHQRSLLQVLFSLLIGSPCGGKVPEFLLDLTNLLPGGWVVNDDRIIVINFTQAVSITFNLAQTSPTPRQETG
ncbi:hypothetical protein OK016_20340 [Vibrio chagasii]|nr:hypothetical protein [Vibrio chagasii]